MEDNSPLVETTTEITFNKKERKLDKIVAALYKGINNHKVLIIVLWIILGVCFAYPALSFLGATTVFINPPKGSPAYDANQLYQEKYPETFKTGENIIVIKNLKNESVLNEYVETFSKSMEEWMKEQELIVSYSGYYLLPNSTGMNVIDSKVVEKIKNEYVGESGTVTIIKAVLDDSNEKNVISFIKTFRKKINELNTNTEEYYIGLTGFEAGSVELSKEVDMSLLKMDLTCIPVAILVLLWVLQSFSLMIIPLCTLVLSFLCSFGMMYPISFGLDVYGIAPALMMAVVAAMSIDYCLFLLKRWQEETLKSDNYYQCVENTFHHAGRIIFTSGGLLALSFVSLCFFPVEIVISFGIAPFCSIVATLAVHLTFVPAILSLFPEFFARRGFLSCVDKCRLWSEKREKNYHSRNSLWHKFSVLLSSKRNAVIAIIICLLFILPFCVYIKDFSWTDEDRLCIPAESDTMISRDYVLGEFDDGIIYPYKVIISANSSEYGVHSNAFHNVTREIMRNVVELSEDYSNSSYLCFNYFNGMVLTPNLIKMVSRDPLYNWFFENSVSDDNTTSSCSLIPLFNPKINSTGHIEDLRNIFDKVMEMYPQYSIYIRSFSVDISDSVVACFDYFPIIIAILFTIVMIITGLSFQSFVVPIRIAFSTFITVLWIYGFASFVFGTTYFDGLSSLMKLTDGFYWVAPIITFPIIIGLSSDYDIFLFSRIQELRRKGLSTKLSTVVGVEKVGYLISYAGIIMAIAFSGLFFSKVLMLQQFAFILMFSVLLDTFVIRTIVLPSFVHILGEWNWLPNKYETEYDDYLQYDQMISPDVSEETPFIN